MSKKQRLLSKKGATVVSAAAIAAVSTASIGPATAAPVDSKSKPGLSFASEEPTEKVTNSYRGDVGVQPTQWPKQQ